MHNRSVESVHVDARWCARLDLPTGRTLSLVTDWKPSHWDEHRTTNREQIVRSANRERDDLEERFGLTGIAFRVYEEHRRTERVVDTYTTETFASEHPAKCELPALAENGEKK